MAGCSADGTRRKNVGTASSAATAMGTGAYYCRQVVRESRLEVAQAAGKVVASAAGSRWHLVPRREFDNRQPNALCICKSFACLLPLTGRITAARQCSLDEK